jgi:hypothetical protein
LNLLKHWRREGADDFECELLAVGRRERPSAGARRRAISFLRGASATVAASSATAAAASTSVAKAGVTLATAVKWTGAGLLIGLAAVGTRHATLTAPTPATAPAAAPSAVPVATSVSSAPTSVQAEPAPSASVRKVVVPPSPPTRARPRAAGQGLRAELREIEAARAAISRGDLDVGQRHLDAYAALPQSSLGPEAELLNLKLLLARGDRKQAAARARAFLRGSPTSPHAERVARLLAQAEGESGINPASRGNSGSREAR